MLTYLLDYLRMRKAGIDPPPIADWRMHRFEWRCVIIPDHRQVLTYDQDGYPILNDSCADGHDPIPTGYTVCVNGVLIERQLCQRCGEVVEVTVKP